MSAFNFSHGDEVKDRITGLKGIVVARTDWFNKCVRITVQPTKLKADGAPHDAVTFDQEQLELVKASKIEPPQRERTGGPCDDKAALRR